MIGLFLDRSWSSVVVLSFYSLLVARVPDVFVLYHGMFWLFQFLRGLHFFCKAVQVVSSCSASFLSFRLCMMLKHILSCFRLFFCHREKCQGFEVLYCC